MPDSWDYSTPRERKAQMPFAPLITGLLIAFCFIFTIANYFPHGDTNSLWDRLARIGTVSPDRMWEGAYYVLFTSVFVHGSIMHIVFNMIWLYRLGTVLESTLSPWAYALFFFTATVVASGVQIAFTGVPGIGASGAVYAMFGLLWAGRGAFVEWRQVATRENMNIFLIWGVFCIFTTWAGYMPIANGAHFGGLVFGLAIGWLFYAPRKQPLWSIPLAIVIIATICSVTWMPWSGMWTWWKGNKEEEQKHYAEAITWYHRSIRLGESPEPLWTNIGIAWMEIHNAAKANNQPKVVEDAIQKAEEAWRHTEAGPRQEPPKQDDVPRDQEDRVRPTTGHKK